MSSPLLALLQLLTSEVKTVESLYSKNGVAFPSLDEAFSPSPLDNDESVANASRTIIAAASHLIALVRSPMESLQEQAAGVYSSNALGLMNELNVPNVLLPVSDEGMNVVDIASNVGVETAFIARNLRYLSTRHIFREVSPDVFANNRISSLLVKPKPLEEIKADPLSRYDGAPVSALVGHFTDEPLIGSAHYIKFIKNPDGYQSPFNMAVKDKTNIFAWFGGVHVVPL